MTIDLKIASFRVRFCSDDPLKLRLAERFSAFVCTDPGIPDLTIRVCTEGVVIPPEAEKVFDAPLVEETQEEPRITREQFWTVYRDRGNKFIRVQLKDPDREALLVVPDNSSTWNICLKTDNQELDPMPYPVDGLILYFMVSAAAGIMIHASGIISRGRGWIFSGVSGKGKTTIAKIFDSCGDMVIHDDRLILLKEGDQWVMHNTPVYRNEEPRSHKLDRIWLISHGKSNASVPVSGVKAVAGILANCIQQNWDATLIAGTASAVEDLACSVSISTLKFVPDASVRDYLLAREENCMKISSQAAMQMLSEGKTVSVTAGGSSMWPAIKPGERVTIEPLNDYIPVKGDVVALLRDGGFVIHRITATRITNSKFSFITRGDSSLSEDTWSDISEISGIAKSVFRSGIQQDIKRRRLPFIFNRISALLSGYFKIRIKEG